MSKDVVRESRIYVLEDGGDDSFIVSGSIIPEVYNQEAENNREYTERLVGAVALAELLQADSDH